MVGTRHAVVGEEEHIVDEGVEPVEQLTVAAASLNEVGYLARGVVVSTQRVGAVAHGVKAVVAHALGTVAEEGVDHIVGDDGGEHGGREMEPVGLYLLWRKRQRRGKLSEQSAHGVDGYLPDAEEAKNMVYAVGVEVVGHTGEAAVPPLAAVVEHSLPVVGGEAPVLPIYGKIIGWSTRLTVETEVAGLHPHIAALAVNADRYVALEDDATTARMVVGSRHLGMQDILHEVVVSHLAILGGAWGGEGCAVGLIPRRMAMPTAEVGGACIMRS